MIYVFLSVCCSVIVSVLLKLARRYHINIYQAITWNYSMAIVLSWIFLKPQMPNLQQAPVVSYLFLGLLLPALFVVMGISIRKSGIVRTDVAQRLSLFIPIIASFWLLHEKITPLKLAGIILGFIAIACSIPLQNNGRIKKVSAHAWIYLLLVFIGFGVIDVLFRQMALNKTIAYNTSLFVVFVLAFIFSLAGLIYRVMAKKIRFSWLHIPLGWILGTVNFCNILFYLKAHRVIASHPSTVFSAVNIGVIVLGALTGMVVFKEKLSLLNKAGIVLAIIAIIVIANSQ
jgi:drug/metabolite transporter (DMT)-like permease